MITNNVAALRFESGFWFEMQVQINNIEIIKRKLESDYFKNTFIKRNITSSI